MYKWLSFFVNHKLFYITFDNLVVKCYNFKNIYMGDKMSKVFNKKTELIWYVRRIFKELSKISNEYLIKDDITAPQRAILEFLLREGALSVPQMAKKYSVSRQHMQVNVNALLKKGFITTKENKEHKKSKLLVLTSSGKELFTKIQVYEENLIDKLYKDISQTDINITKNTLEMIYIKANGISNEI